MLLTSQLFTILPHEKRKRASRETLKFSISLKTQTPLTALNEFFPAGIPIASATPTLDLDDWECFEANISSFSITKQADIMEILFSKGVPDRIGYACFHYGVVAIPAEWVEVTT